MLSTSKPSSLARRLLAGALLAAGSSALLAQAPPAPGASPRIDAIKKAGELRVGVLQNAPWLNENTTGNGAAWDGPAWLLANEYARLLGVKLRTVAVSHETKVPVLAANQVDMTISPLGETPERLKVVMNRRALHPKTLSELPHRRCRAVSERARQRRENTLLYGSQVVHERQYTGQTSSHQHESCSEISS